MWIDLVQNAIIDPASKVAVSTSLRAGQALHGVIEESQGGLVLAAGGTRIAVPEGSSLVPGQSVSVEVRQTPSGLQLRVAPAAPPPVQETAVVELFARVLGSVGGLLSESLSADLLPQNLPQTEPAIRAWLGALFGHDALGEDVGTLTTVLARADAAGALTGTARDVLDLLGQLIPRLPGGGRDLGPVLQRLAGTGARSTESLLARAFGMEDLPAVAESLRADLRAVLAQLRGNESLATYLRETGEARGFNEAADRLIARLTAIQLQNLRGLEQPYLFFEIAFAQESPIRSAQIHVFPEGKGRQHQADASTASVALDLSTTRLGDLWISLRLAEGHCMCRFLAASPDTVEAIEHGSPELAKALDSAGYPCATVHVALWDGNRLREIANLMRRFSGIDLTA